MKKLVKGLGYALLLVAVLVAVVGFTQREKISRLYAVVTLFDEDTIVQNFSNMNDVMLAAPLERDRPTDPWPKKTGPLPSTFLHDGKVEKLEDFLAETSTTALLVIHDGVIVHEDYRLGTAQEDLRISWSVAKSFLSAVFGIALDEGKIASLRDPVDKYVPALSQSAYAGVAIEDVLHMSSGVRFNEDYFDYDSDINKMGRVLALGASMDEFAASMHERERPAGEQWQYVSIDTHVLSMVLRAATQRSLTDYLSERLWQPLGTDGDGYYLTDGDGAAFALGGLNMQTRDYARFGELFRNNGKWKGQQVVPEAWTQVSTRNSAPGMKRQSQGYGYQWWLPENSDGEFFAGGIYGQYIYVNRVTGVVVVKNSAHRTFNAPGVRTRTIEFFRSLAKHYDQ
ncbi:MAG: serine hydrolase domain-containing protein [Gammaproteobacteria bacterium]